MGGANTLKTEGLMLQGMCVSHVRAGCKVELPVISICSIRTETGEAMATVRPRPHKAIQAKRFQGNAWKNIKGMGCNDIREFRDNGRGRWGHIPDIGGGVSIG